MVCPVVLTRRYKATVFGLVKVPAIYSENSRLPNIPHGHPDHNGFCGFPALVFDKFFEWPQDLTVPCRPIGCGTSVRRQHAVVNRIAKAVDSELVH